MLKNIITVLAILSFFAIVYFGWEHYRSLNNQAEDIYYVIPENAALVFDFQSIGRGKKNISETEVWKELSVTGWAGEINRNIAFLDSLFSNNEETKQLTGTLRVVVSAHQTGGNNMSFLFTVLPPKGWRENKIVDFIASAASKKNLSQRNFNNSIIYTINSGDKSCHFTYSNGIISFTFSSVLAEETIRNTEMGHTLLNDSAFQTIKRTASLSNDFNLFINYKFLNVLLKPALSTEAENTLSFITNYAGWTELDTRAKQNFFQLNGFTTSNDSTGNYLSLFNNENPGKPDLFRIIPSSAAWISHFFVSDIETYSSRFRGVFSNKEADDSIAFFNSMCGTSFQKKFFGECSGEFAAIINRPSMADFTSGTMAVFKLKHPKNTETILQETSDSLIKNSGSNLQAEKFSEFEIKPFPAGRIFNYLLGNVFTYSAVNYYVIIDNSVVFANNTDALAALINSYNTDKTISKDKDFISLSDNLASESNIFIYCNIPRSYPLFSAFAGESLIEALTLHHSIIKKMGVVSLQVSYTKNNLFYNNFILKHNAGYKEPEIQSGNKWSLTLDGNAFTKPASVINHNTGEQEIFVQDDGGNIYLIDNSGEILWKRKTEGQIMSDIHQIDVYKNGKLQLLFNTPQYIYLIDRNGQNVSGFPIKLNAAASAPMSLLDYEKNKDYRIIIPCSNGNVYNYDKSGKVVDGWNTTISEAEIIYQIKHFSAEKKDYLIAIDKNRKINVVDRRGEQRENISVLFPENIVGGYYPIANKTFSSSNLIAADSTGKIFSISFKNKTDSVSASTVNSAVQHFTVADIDYDGTPEYLLCSGKELIIVNQKAEIITSKLFDETISYTPEIIAVSKNEKIIGVVCAELGKAFLINTDGTLKNDVNIMGTGHLSFLTNKKSGALNYVISSENKLLLY